MPNRPNPAQFAQYSYILAIVSAGILALAFALGFIPSPVTKSIASVIVWLVLLTGGIGAFMGYAANADFRAQSASADLVSKARIGFRTNLGALIVTLLLALLSLGIALLTKMAGR